LGAFHLRKFGKSFESRYKSTELTSFKAVINAAVGLVAGQREANKIRFEALFEDSDIGRSLRAQVIKMIDSQSIEFAAHDIELGFRYDNGFLVDDGTEAPESDPFGQIYRPTTRPGHRLPHAWIEKEDKMLSTHDIVGRDVGFSLITDDTGRDWLSIADQISADHGIRISTAQIGEQAHYRDYDDQWEKVKGIKPGGALLVRPDNIVAWRSLRPSQRGGAEVQEAIGTLLGNSIWKLMTNGINGVH
jgi:2,4-dichlorophenol 6-monooxygenase